MLYRKIRYGYKFRRIPLTQDKPVGQKPVEARYAIVDADDYEKLNCYNWQCLTSSSTFYAVRLQLNNEKAKIMRMHREIMQSPKDRVVDHINHNGLDNRKSNLRIATATENRRNCRKIKAGSSKYKGVYKRRGKWEAAICYNKRHAYLGRFEDEIEAAKAYDEAAKEHHKEFAVLNFNEELKS